MSCVIRAISRPSEEDLKAATEALAKAFDYKFFSSALDGNEEHVISILRAHLTAAAVEGEMLVAEVPDVGITGAAAWFGPGQKFLATDKQRNEGWNELMSRLPPKYQEWWKYFLGRYDELAEQSFGPNAKLGGYHLQVIGVIPDQQHKGIGRALMKYAEDKAAASKVPSYVETIGGPNVNLYQNMGYEIAGSGPIKTPGGDHEFDMTFLVKHTETSHPQSV